MSADLKLPWRRAIHPGGRVALIDTTGATVFEAAVGTGNGAVKFAIFVDAVCRVSSLVDLLHRMDPDEVKGSNWVTDVDYTAAMRDSERWLRDLITPAVEEHA